MPKKIIAIIGVSAALGILFDYFFYNKMPPGLSFPLYILLILACLFALGKNFKERPSNDALWLILPLLFFSVMVSVRASYFLSFLNIVMSGFILLMVARTFFKDNFTADRIARSAQRASNFTPNYQGSTLGFACPFYFHNPFFVRRFGFSKIHFRLD